MERENSLFSISRGVIIFPTPYGAKSSDQDPDQDAGDDLDEDQAQQHRKVDRPGVEAAEQLAARCDERFREPDQELVDPAHRRIRVLAEPAQDRAGAQEQFQEVTEPLDRVGEHHAHVSASLSPRALVGLRLRFRHGVAGSGDRDVLRREDEDVVGDLLDVAVQRVGGAGQEVEDLAGRLRLQSLKVDDDRLTGLKAVDQRQYMLIVLRFVCDIEQAIGLMLQFSFRRAIDVTSYSCQQ